MRDTSFSTLKAGLSTCGTGFAAVIDGVLNVRTVSETANGAAAYALCATGIRLVSNCWDPDCSCKLETLAKVRPDVRIVPVSVIITDPTS